MMNQYTADRCAAKAKSCMSVFQAIASGDYSDQWIRRNLLCVESDLDNLLYMVHGALHEREEDDGNEE